MFVALANGPYAEILEEARGSWAEADLRLTFDGQRWVASIPVQPPGTPRRWVTGLGPTRDRAVLALREALALPREHP